MGKKNRKVEVLAAAVETMLAPGTEEMQKAAMAEAQAEVAAPKPTSEVLVLGAKAPKHRVGHNGAAWAVIVPLLPCSAAKLAELPELKVPQCGGPKGNGMLYVGYAIRRGWLTRQA